MKEQIDELRARISALQAEAEALRDAPMCRAEKRAEVLTQCKAWAAEGERRLRYRVVEGDYIGMFAVQPEASGRVNLGPVLAAVLGAEELANSLCRHTAGLPTGPTATTAARAKRLEEIDAERLALEIEEETLVEASEAAGYPVARRADADPRAVLGGAE